MNIHPRRWRYDRVASSRKNSRGDLQSCAGYWLCFGMKGVVLCNTHGVKIVKEAGGVFNTRGEEYGGVSGKNGCIYSSSCDFLVPLVRYDNFDSYPAFCWLANTKWPSLYLAQPLGISCMRSPETRFSDRGDKSSWCRALLLHRTPHWPLRPRASRSNLSSSQEVPTVQPSNMPTTMPSGWKSTHISCHRIENLSFFTLRWFELCQMEIPTGKLRIYTGDRSKHCPRQECNTMIILWRRHEHPSSSANRPSDVGITLNINAEYNQSSIWWELTP